MLRKPTEKKAEIAERDIAPFKLAVVALATIVYVPFLRNWPQTIRWLGDLNLAFAWAYSLFFFLVKPYQLYPVLVSSYFSSLMDTVAIGVGTYATGGIDSPIFVIYYASLLGVAFRFGFWETIGAAGIYSASYLLVLAVSGQIEGHAADIIMRVGIMLVMAPLGAFFARESLKETQGKMELQKLSRELERSNKELEQFAHVASHDLQEPLRAVASYVGILGQKYKGRLDADADEYISFAVEGAARMQEMIHDLLEYSQAGTRKEPFQPVDINQALNQAIDSLSFAIKESDATVTYDRLPVITADASQIQHLFQNLLGNAVKFHGQEPPHLHVSAKRGNDEWIFSVADNGIGIDPRYFERIFLIFEHLHSRSKYGGTGIGLATCKRIVERHGGRIWVESEPGNGATFYFTIPQSLPQ